MKTMFRVRRVSLVVGILILAAGVGLAAGDGVDPLAVEGPVAAAYNVSPAGQLAATVAVPLNLSAVRAEDEGREAAGLPPRFAVPESVWLTPGTAGTWVDLDARYVMWRTRITAPGALSLNLGFTGYWLPPGARLSLYPTDFAGLDDRRGHPVFTAADNEDHGQLWTPVILADDIVVELVLPRGERDNYRLELTTINQGYRFFGEPAADKAGTCNVDVVCPEGNDWRAEINSVGAISTGGSTFCTGVMVNNTASDGKPYFLTANHCNINVGNAASLVVYWNYQSPVCGDQSGGVLDQFMSGATFRAASATSDFTLVEMDDAVDPSLGVTFAGWDRSTADPVSATAIHHPRGDEKSISFENDPTSTTSYLQFVVPGDGTHLRVTDWDTGTTEPGSSGCPLFDQNHRVVGQLHGGYAACGNDDSDWFGRLSVSWEGDGTPETRLRDYLDPSGSGAVAVDLYDPQAASITVTPLDAAAATGVVGGPFAPLAHAFSVANNGVAAVEFAVSTAADWLELDTTGGSLAVGQQLDVTVSIVGLADNLGVGAHRAEISFVNQSGGSGSTTRDFVLTVTENSLGLIGAVPNPVSVAPIDIRYTLRGDAGVRARIDNIRGLAVRDLGTMSGVAGNNTINWDGLDDHGRRVPAGVYVITIKALGREYRTSLTYVH